MRVSMVFEEFVRVGENKRYVFLVARVPATGRWVGLAIEHNGPALFLQLVHPGGGDGLDDRDDAIRVVACLAGDAKLNLGGIDTWHVDDALRSGARRYMVVRPQFYRGLDDGVSLN